MKRDKVNNFPARAQSRIFDSKYVSFPALYLLASSHADETIRLKSIVNTTDQLQLTRAVPKTWDLRIH